MRSAFHGQLLELPGVSVDNFSDLTCQAYLLSHCHADHTAGLYSPALLAHLQEEQVYVYMSQPSAAIVQHECGGGELMHYVRALPIGTSSIPVRGNPLTDSTPQHVGVRVLPAGHCWGSVMFLITTMYHTVLYTGDFRLAENTVHNYAHLHDEHGDVIHIDTLYVDTTFGASPHRVLPSRSDSVARALSHIQAWLCGGAQCRVSLHTSARYGYEFLFKQIQETLHQPVLVGHDIWPLYCQFPRQVRGVTNDPSITKLHLCRNRTHNKSHEACLPNHCATHKYLYVHFSALKWTDYETEDDTVKVFKDGGEPRIDVCFATHCSYTELEYFVRYLRPRRVVGFPNEYKTAERSESHVKVHVGSGENKMAGGQSDMNKMAAVRSEHMSDNSESETKCDDGDKIVDRETLRKIFFEFDD